MPGRERERTLYCRVQDVWILESIDSIIRTKRTLGVRTSFSYEIMRLVRNSLLNARDGEAIDREVMRGVVAEGDDADVR